MSLCRVLSCVVGKGCLLWPVTSFIKTLLGFALLHSVLQGQICLLLQVFFDFLLLHPSLYNEKDILGGDVSSRIGEGNGTPLQYSCLENPMDGGAWWAVVHGVAKSRTQLGDFTFTFHFHTLEREMATHSSFLPGESQGWGSLVGCCLWDHTELDTTEVT